ncbi:isochorismatase family protein [Cryobacterium zongtaii]|uniref:isochorismatase family protein n=1 Tax=Cryobacterium zongtaii TaxID=1259217 RepID=UPI0013FE0E3C|nr:isochorismatase family protein [Cryobacterium zongtaii]
MSGRSHPERLLPRGRIPLTASESAAVIARAASTRPVHRNPCHALQHLAIEPDATFFVPVTTGVEIYPRVATERHFIKGSANAFIGTGLKRLLREEDIEHLVILGMMTSMRIDATARAAVDLRLFVTVVHDACAAPDFDQIPAH